MKWVDKFLALVLLVTLGSFLAGANKGNYVAGHYGSATFNYTCDDANRGAIFFVISTGGSSPDRFLTCTSSQSGSLGFAWRSMFVTTNRASAQ